MNDISHLNESLRRELLEMRSEDDALRERLAAEGTLFEGYHPEMAQLHQRNATGLQKIIKTHGWPHAELVGDDGAEAAWLIAQHAIVSPKLMRKVLEEIKLEAERGRCPKHRVAMLEDRICLFEGRKQIYGTQFDWDESGKMSPYPPIQDPDQVDQRRSHMGLEPLDQAIEKMQVRTESSNERPPANLAKHRAEMAAWARSVGWRT